MNKKGKFYSNNKSIGFTKIKDIQQKSNQKQILSRSMERRKKANPLPEPTTEKYPKVKAGQNKSKKVKLEKKQNISSTRNEKPTKRKEYANTISANEMIEENTQSHNNEKKINYLRSNNEEKVEQDNNKTNISKYNNDQQKIEPKNQKIKNNQIKNNNDDEEDYSEEEEEEKDDDLIYRTLYRSSNKNVDKTKEKEEKLKKYKEKEKEKELNNQSVKIDRNLNNNFDITMEQTDNLHFNNENKKMYINAYNNKTKPHKRSIKRPKNKPKENKTDYNNINENEELYHPKTYEKRKLIDNIVSDPERVIDLFIIDDDYDIKYLTKTKKKINRKNNKFREIIIENFEPNMPNKKEKFTGFIFIRKSKGKKMYTLELPDDLEQINEILKNESVMIKNQLIQMIPMNKIQALINQAQTQNEVKKSQNEKNLEKELEKEKELIKDKERQLTLLKNKNEELNNTIKKQTKQISQYEKDMKNIKFNHDQLKDSFQALEQENKSLKSQVQAQRIRRKSIQMQMEEESNQRNLQEMKDRIQKYKNDLRKSLITEEKEKNRKSALDQPSNHVLQEKEKEKTKNKSSIKDMVQAFENKKKEEKEEKEEKVIVTEKEKDNEEEKDKKVEEEENYEDDYNYDMYDERDPKAKKMKKAMARFRKKYKDIIIENKKSQKQKEKEEKEKEESEKKELNLNDSNEEENSFIKEKEERERKEKEEKERKQKEEQEKKERERKDREKKEKEEKERKERERKQKEEQERKEREEKERKEREKKEKEEKEKKEKEKNKPGPFGGIQNKMANNFSKMLADKMKFGPMPGVMKKRSGSINNNAKPQIIIEKKVDVVNLIQTQQFKRTNKKKPTRKMFMD